MYFSSSRWRIRVSRVQATEKRESIGTSSFQGLDGLGGLAKKLGTSKARHAAGTVVVCTPAWLEQGDVEGAEEGKFSPQISSLLPSDDELIWDRRGSRSVAMPFIESRQQSVTWFRVSRGKFKHERASTRTTLRRYFAQRSDMRQIVVMLVEPHGDLFQG